MGTFSAIIQFIIPLGIINVWLLRSGRATNYRGGASTSLKAEFTAYGLSGWVFYVVGAFKLLAAGMLLLGFYLPNLTLLGASLLTIFMLGAVLMHAKIKDPAIRYVPAGLMLLMSLLLVSMSLS